MRIPKSPLFEGVDDQDLDSMMHCLSAKKRHYKKEEFIFHSGDKAQQIGMVLSGTVHMMKEDFWGNRMILGEAGPGDLFGEVYACAGVKWLEVNVIAKTDTDILFLDIQKILTVCSNGCEFHSRMIRNLLSSISRRTLAMTRKVEHMSQRTLRDKVLSYLSSQAVTSESREFTIPYNRQQLAEYLSVDRSALSSELGKMRDQGILEFHKNWFHLKE